MVCAHADVERSNRQLRAIALLATSLALTTKNVARIGLPSSFE
jgi:hypothetical protein